MILDEIGHALVKWCSQMPPSWAASAFPHCLKRGFRWFVCGKHQTIPNLFAKCTCFFWWLTNSSQSNATHNPLQLLVSKCFQPPSSFKELRLSTILHIEWICIAGGQCLAIRHIFQWGIQMGWCFNCGNQTWQVKIIICKYWEITCKHSESLNKLTKHSWESTINVVFIGKSSVNIRKWSMAGDVYNSCATSEARHAMTVGTRTQNWRVPQMGVPQ